MNTLKILNFSNNSYDTSPRQRRQKLDASRMRLRASVLCRSCNKGLKSGYRTQETSYKLLFKKFKRLREGFD